MATATKQRRHGKLHELPGEIRREVNDLLIEPSITYEDVAQYLQGKGYDISKSSIGRYGQQFFNEVRETEMLRDQAALLTSEPDQALLLEKLTATMLTKRLALAMQDPAFDVLKHPKMIDSFAKLQQSSTQREKWSNEIRKAAEKAVKEIEKKAKKLELQPDTLKYIKEVIYGLTN
jgi:histidinol phosphatase-like PHP family hydrolase